MGAAIESFAGASLLRVPRTRFVPVKTTDDLLVLRSDAYALTDELYGRAVPDAPTACPTSSSTRATTSCWTPSSALPGRAAVAARGRRLIVHGDVTFGAGVVVRGAVELDEAGRFGSSRERCWNPARDRPAQHIRAVTDAPGDQREGAGGRPITIVLADDHRVVRPGRSAARGPGEGLQGVVAEAGEAWPSPSAAWLPIGPQRPGGSTGEHEPDGSSAAVDPAHSRQRGRTTAFRRPNHASQRQARPARPWPRSHRLRPQGGGRVRADPGRVRLAAGPGTLPQTPAGRRWARRGTRAPRAAGRAQRPRGGGCSA